MQIASFICQISHYIQKFTQHFFKTVISTHCNLWRLCDSAKHRSKIFLKMQKVIIFYLVYSHLYTHLTFNNFFHGWNTLGSQWATPYKLGGQNYFMIGSGRGGLDKKKIVRGVWVGNAPLGRYGEKTVFFDYILKKNSSKSGLHFRANICKTDLLSRLSATTLPKTVYGYLQIGWSHPISKTLRAQKRKSASNFYKRS